jgi:EmrB/QacA subfamily drug resistance transporter
MADNPAPNTALSAAAARRAGLLVATLASFFTPFMSSSINIALPSIAREFSLDAVTLSWVATAFLLAAAVFIVPFGRLADIHGRKRVFILGVIVFTLACLMAAVARSGSWLIAARVFQGIGSAILAATSMAILTSVYPARERGKVLGFQVAAVYIGLSLGPSIGGLLTQHLGWRSIFAFALPLGILTLAATFWKLKGEWAEARGERFDFAGSVVYGASLVALMFGFSRLPLPRGAWVLLAGVAGLVVFVLWERRVPAPVLNVRLFSLNPVFAFSNLAALINYSATSAVSFLLSLYLQYIKGLSPQTAGLVLITQPLVMAVLSPLAGRYSDRFEPRLLASIGMSVTTIGLILLTLVDRGTSMGFIIFTLLVLGLGFGLFSSPNSNAVMSAVERRYYGVASGTLGTMRLTGQMLSLGITMLLFAVYMGQVKITPDLYPLFLKSARTGFIVFAVLCFGGVFASLAKRNGNRQPGLAGPHDTSGGGGPGIEAQGQRPRPQ